MHKIHKIQKSKPEKSHTNGERNYSDVVYIPTQMFIILCASLLNSCEDRYTYYKKGYRYIWRWESTAAT